MLINYASLIVLGGATSRSREDVSTRSRVELGVKMVNRVDDAVLRLAQGEQDHERDDEGGQTEDSEGQLQLNIYLWR